MVPGTDSEDALVTIVACLTNPPLPEGDVLLEAPVNPPIAPLLSRLVGVPMLHKEALQVKGAFAPVS